jgi:hypothetical protein
MFTGSINFQTPKFCHPERGDLLEEICSSPTLHWQDCLCHQGVLLNPRLGEQIFTRIFGDHRL